MGFHFKLEAILRLRLALEEESERRLSRVLQRESELRQTRQCCENASRMWKSNLHSHLLEGWVSAAELQFGVAVSLASVRRSELLGQRLQAIKGEVQRSLEAHLRQRREREILASLRDSQGDEFAILERRREQATLDCLYLVRQAHLARAMSRP